MEKCKIAFPKYISTLKKTNIPDLELKLIKKIILLYLKEYFKHNNNKFNRNRFNVDFINMFLSKLASPEFLGVSSLKIQSVITNFINYLSLQNVLHKSITKELLKTYSINLVPSSEKRNKTKKMSQKDTNQVSFSEIPYSEKKLEKLMKNTEEMIDKFINSNESQQLSDIQIKEAYWVIYDITEQMYMYFLQTPENWEPSTLEYICLEVLPSKIVTEQSFFKAIVPVLMTYISFLKNKRIIMDTHTEQLMISTYQMSDLIVEEALNPANWSFMKTTLMEAMEAGIDMEDKETLQSYVRWKMIEHNLSIIPHVTMERVESLTTEEIIKKLRDYGIKFKKEQFMLDIRRFYSVEELIRNWETSYTIDPECSESDFIFFAATVLWERLAPDIINSEKIAEMMENGYDFFDKNEEEEVCEVWLQAWEHLKERFKPEMRNIRDADAIYSFPEYIMDWSQDFMMALWNANLFQELINLGRELLKCFPYSSDLYIHNVLRYIAESLFALEQIEEGEKEFKDLVERFPENPWGYIGWGDQYSNFRENYFNYEKAKTSYLKGLEVDDSEKETVARRIEFLEIEKERMCLRKSLISEYETFLSEKELNERNTDEKKGHARLFLNYVISQCKHPYLEELLDEGVLDGEIILNFLGLWCIYQKIVGSKTALIKLCRSVKHFMKFMLECYNIFSKEEIEEIQQILNSREFFVECFESYQQAKGGAENQKEHLVERGSIYSHWNEWYRSKKVLKTESKKKIRLSASKRKYFKDII